MRFPHIDKIPPKSAAFCIRFQFFTVLSLPSVAIKYQFFTSVIIWYQFFRCVRKVLYQFFTRVSFHTNFSHSIIWYQCFNWCEDLVPIMWGFGTNSSHFWKFGIVLSYLRIIVPVLHTLKIVKFEHKFYNPQKNRNWPYVNFTFAKSNVLVPILHMVCNLRSEKFVAQQCSAGGGGLRQSRCG